MAFDIQASIDSGINNPAVLLYLSGITLQLALDALNTYIEPTSWYPPPNDEDEAQNYIDTAAKELMSKSMIVTGMMVPYATSGTVAVAPTGWLFCLGGEVDKAEYADLYATIANAYGTPSNPDNFVLPNMATRVIAGTDNSISGAFSIAHTGGAQTITLSSANMPPHTHSYGTFNTTLPSGAVTGVGRYITTNATGTTGSAGGSGGAAQAFSIMQPYIALYWLIKT